MGAFSGPDISENGLVLALDAGNQKSLNIPSQSDHGYADWYCYISGTATYSIINSTGGIIYERDGSTVTALVTATTPQRGSITVTAGRFYYGSVPINLIVEDQHHWIAPLTMTGTQFWNIAARAEIVSPPTTYFPTIYYIYSPYQTATVNFYDGVATGLAGTPTSTTNISAGTVGTFTTSTNNNHWISSNVPVLATVTRNGADRTILSPMSTYVYQRFQAYYNTTNNTTPTTPNAYVTYDSTYKVMNMSIADGAGGDCAQGLGLEYLSDTYSWGNVVSDYTMVFPYNGTFTASYWSGTNWVVWDTHTVTTGSITNPPRITRDGTNGPGVESTNLSGAQATMASGATLWKWEGNAPFYLAINDSVDDEFSVLGWNSSTQNTPRSSNTIIDISGNGRNGTLTSGPIYVKDNGGSLVFDGVDDYVETSSFTPNITNKTFCSWVKLNSTTQQGGGLIGLMSSDGGTFDTIVYNETNQGWGFGSDLFNRTAWSNVKETSTNVWSYICATYSNNDYRLYRNGVQILQTTSFSALNFNFSSKAILGKRHATSTGPLNAYISNGLIYNRALTASEIQQNFNATRSRFGI